MHESLSVKGLSAFLLSEVMLLPNILDLVVHTHITVNHWAWKVITSFILGVMIIMDIVPIFVNQQRNELLAALVLLLLYNRGVISLLIRTYLVVLDDHPLQLLHRHVGCSWPDKFLNALDMNLPTSFLLNPLDYECRC